MTPSLPAALAAGPVVVDGGLSTELEARGHDVSSSLWSARLLRDDPDAVVAVHAAFAAAGAHLRWELVESVPTTTGVVLGHYRLVR